ncbi:MAG: hypothetical protein NE334_00235 [Lentisphaeraceae bacterium]|nr:hypothetical protein [Lentisphaeraceae bacterium]
MKPINLQVLNIFQNHLPSELIKRGNAFSQISLKEEDQIKAIWENFDFEEICLSNNQNDLVKGECFLVDNFGREEEFYVEVKGISSLNQNNMTVEQFIIDCCAQEISLTLSS